MATMLTDKATGRTVKLEKSSKRGMTKVVTFDPATEVETAHEFKKADARAHFANLYDKQGWR